MAVITRSARVPAVRAALDRLAAPVRGAMAALGYNPAGRAATWALLIIVVISFLAPVVVPEPPPDYANIYAPPSAAHPLGTDFQGADVLAQVLRGGQTVLIVGAVAAAVSTLIAITFGALAAYAGGWLDGLITGLADIVLTIPNFPLLAVLAAYLRLNNPLFLALLIAVLSWPTLLRAVRGQVLSLKERDYVEAARALDLGTLHILFREILPNMRAYIAMYFVLSMTGAIYAQVGLYLLGFAPLAGDNWGIMLNLAWYRGAIFYKNSFWYIMAPIVAISVVQLAMVTMTRSLEEAFNPRLRKM
ncbi:MAG TPA: ABC transporter permease [Isosphaeraceae bacterium]|nr:ABC transporter permease [Isosphaeraceae bacterium]